MRQCPICGREYIEYPAISRKDNLTEISVTTIGMVTLDHWISKGM